MAATTLGSACSEGSGEVRERDRVPHYNEFSWHGHGTTHGIPWHPRGIPWCGIGFHGRGAVGGTVACHGWYLGNPRDNRHDTPW